MTEFSIVEANHLAFRHVDGWVGDRVWSICEFLRDDQRDHGVSGAIAEIGVHHGKLFFIIAHIARPGERLVAIDLFEDQAKNIDSSGRGSIDAFRANIDRHFPHLRERVTVVAADSLSLTPTRLGALFPEGVRVLSVDGGHTVAHVVNDLSVAQDVLAPRGCVLLDDFMGPHWPSVSEGFFRFMDRGNRRLAPFLVFQNKLFLTTITEQAQVLEALRAFLDRAVGDEIHSGRWRYSTLCGWSVLCFA
jgi:SAM-dependent methyltransferase